MSLDDVTAVRMALEGWVGKTVLGGALTIIIGGIGLIHSEFAELHADVSNHSAKLSGISQKIDDLIIADQNRARSTDAAIGKLADTEQQHSIAIAHAEDEIEAMRRDPPPHVESIPVPQPLPAIGNALSHIIPGLHPHRQWRRRP